MVRNAGQGRKVPRRALPAGTRRSEKSLKQNGGRRPKGAGKKSPPRSSRLPTLLSVPPKTPDFSMSEGSLQAPPPPRRFGRIPIFTTEASLDAELRRQFDICHGCRRCFNLCNSFPRLFDLADAAPSGELHDVASSDFKKVADACRIVRHVLFDEMPLRASPRVSISIFHI